MSIRKNKQDIELRGKVIQVLHSESKNIARIYFQPGYFEFPITPEEEYRLEDEVVLSGKLLIEHIKQNILDAK